MEPASTASPDATDVTAELNYTIDTGVKPVNETYGPGELQRRDTGTVDPRQVRVRNGRPLAGQLALDRSGFVLVEHKTQVVDFFDKERLPEVYYPEIEALIAQVS